MALLHLLILLINALLIAASPSNLIHDVAPPAILRTPDFDLDGDFVRGAISDNLKQSLSLIEKAESLPSCGKIATSALLHSCSALEGSIRHDSQLPPGSDLLIEEESDIYAARLAVCELNGADYAVPAECHSFVPKSNAKQSWTYTGWITSKGATKPRVANDYFDEVTAANLKQCRKALGSSSQAWTSYSNNRQNAVAMCHAMQSAVERDESRHIAKILAKTAAASSETLKEAYEQVNEIQHLFHDLQTAMPQFQKELATFDDNIQQRVQEYWEELRRAQTGLEGLTAVIDHHQHSIQEAHAHLEEVFGTVIPDLALAIANASQQVRDTGADAASTSELVAYHMERTQQNFIENMATAGYGLDAINELVPHLSAVMQSTLDNTMRSFETATIRQQELALAQNNTVDGLERIQQTASDVESQLEKTSTSMGRLVTAFERLDGLISPLTATLELMMANLVVLWKATMLGLFSTAMFYEYAKFSLIGSAMAGTVSTMAFATALVMLKDSIAACVEVFFQLLPKNDMARNVGVVAICALLISSLVLTGRYLFRRSSRSPLPYDDYDPLSPPSGAGAWFVWMGEATLDRVTFRRHRPSQLPKSRV